MAQQDGDTWVFALPAGSIQCGSSVVVQIAKREGGRFAGWLSQKSNRYPVTPDCVRIEPTPIEATPPSQGLPASTPTPSLTTSSIGKSVNQQPIEVVRIGNGPRNIVLVGGKHAGYAPGSVQLARKVAQYFGDNPQVVPPDVTLHVVLNANPDSPNAPGRKSGRLNAHEVDLNRNWDCGWKQDALWATQPVSGGSAPFSEPETQALRDFLVDLRPSAVVFWGAKAAGGLVSPGGCKDKSLASEDLARVYATSAGYEQGAFEAYAVTGDASNWLAGQGIPAIAGVAAGLFRRRFRQQSQGDQSGAGGATSTDTMIQSIPDSRAGRRSGPARAGLLALFGVVLALAGACGRQPAPFAGPQMTDTAPAPSPAFTQGTTEAAGVTPAAAAVTAARPSPVVTPNFSPTQNRSSRATPGQPVTPLPSGPSKTPSVDGTIEGATVVHGWLDGCGAHPAICHSAGADARCGTGNRQGFLDTRPAAGRSKPTSSAVARCNW